MTGAPTSPAVVTVVSSSVSVKLRVAVSVVNMGGAGVFAKPLMVILNATSPLQLNQPSDTQELAMLQPVAPPLSSSLDFVPRRLSLSPEGRPIRNA